MGHTGRTRPCINKRTPQIYLYIPIALENNETTGLGSLSKFLFMDVERVRIWHRERLPSFLLAMAKVILLNFDVYTLERVCSMSGQSFYVSGKG